MLENFLTWLLGQDFAMGGFMFLVGSVTFLLFFVIPALFGCFSTDEEENESEEEKK